jgi:hypothetical protein
VNIYLSEKAGVMYVFVCVFFNGNSVGIPHCMSLHGVGCQFYRSCSTAALLSTASIWYDELHFYTGTSRNR